MKLSRFCQYLLSTIKITNWKLHNKGTSAISKSSVFGKSTTISYARDSTIYIGKSCVISPGVSIEAFGGGTFGWQIMYLLIRIAKLSQRKIFL